MAKKKKSQERKHYETYKEGVRAAYKGRIAADCPYAYDSVEGESWIEGFQDGGGKN